jgi:hypothetical protein
VVAATPFEMLLAAGATRYDFLLLNDSLVFAFEMSLYHLLVNLI